MPRCGKQLWNWCIDDTRSLGHTQEIRKIMTQSTCGLYLQDMKERENNIIKSNKIDN